MDGLVTMHQSDDNPFLCAWKDAGGIIDSYTYVGLLLEGRAGMTAAMMRSPGYDVPSEIVFGVQLKKVTKDSCRTDIPPDGSPSSLVPPELQKQMFPWFLNVSRIRHDSRCYRWRRRAPPITTPPMTSADPGHDVCRGRRSRCW